ncbi:MAG: type II secretion system protein [Fimbriimonadaceae bacterium]|nr:type II secretion system protein [Fimbriimonadaceae bacterium]
MAPPTKSRRRRGATIIEGLVAAVVLALSLAGMVSMWSFTVQASSSTDRLGVSYTLARQVMEQAKILGFQNLPEGVTTTYFDANGLSMGATGAKYTVTRTVTTANPVYLTHVQSGAQTLIGGVRTVTVFVDAAVGSAEDYRLTSYLVNSGS